jgi:DNA-binding SARP family transcriptional activator
VEFRILGPLEVLEDGRPLALGRLKERIVLAVLLLHANEFVSRERLIDELWGAAPPPTARKAVNVYVSQLRKTLSRNDQDPIATAEGGYRIAVDGDLLDAARARRVVGQAREQVAAGNTAAASVLLQEALALWRGPTLAGLTFESFGRDEVAALEELRLTALMDRIDCDLAQGGHEQVLGELQVLVRVHPLRERLRAQLMLALYRADRQADALDAYQQARHDLMDELGIEPSESLQRLQQAILRHDPALEAPAGTAATNGGAPEPVALAALPSPPHRRRPWLRRRHLILAGLIVVAAVAATVALLSTSGSGRPPPSGPVSYVGSDSYASIDPKTGKLLGDPGGGVKPGPMAVVGHMLWVVTRGDGKIAPYDLQAAHGMPPIPAGATPYDIAADANGDAWISQRKPFVTWMSRKVRWSGDPYATPATTTVNVPVPLAKAGAEAVGGGYVWVIPGPIGAGDRVALIDVRQRRLDSTIALDRQATAIAYGFGSAWIGTYDPGQQTAWLSKVGPRSRPESVSLETGDGAGPLAVAVGDGSVWVVTSRGTLLRIDPDRLSVLDRIRMSAERPTLLAVGAGFVWTANHNGYSVSQIDAQTDRIVRTIPLGSYSAVPCGIAAVRGGLVVTFGETTCV